MDTVNELAERVWNRAQQESDPTVRKHLFLAYDHLAMARQKQEDITIIVFYGPEIAS